jgi:hypothetical protein
METYRRLALELHYDLPRPDAHRSVLLVTPTAGTVSAHGGTMLAFSMAEELRRPVLLADASPRRPEASRVLECAGARGFADFLAPSNPSLEELLLPTSHENVSFLPAGTDPSVSPAASPERVVALLRAAAARFDFVLLCGGSVLDDSLALALAPHVGCVLLFAIENVTTVEHLDAAQEVLAFCRPRKLGLLLTTPVGPER